MRKPILLVCLVVALLLTMGAAPSAGTPPADVTIVVVTTCDENNICSGTFTVSGQGASLLCPTGQVTDLFTQASGYQNPDGFNIRVQKLFTCDIDPELTFTLQLEVRLDLRGDFAHWVVRDGTGDLVNLHGAGSLIGYPPEEGQEFTVLDVYEGKILLR